MRRPTGYRFPLAIGSHLCDGTRKKKQTKNKNWTRKKFTACRSWALCGINAWEISYLHRERQFQSATLTYCGNLYSAPPPLQLNTRQPSASLQLSPCSVAAAGFVIYLRHDRDIIAKSSYALCIVWTEKNPRFVKIQCFPAVFW